MTTTLNSVTLAEPFDVNYNKKLQGSGQKAANGTWQIDAFSVTLKAETINIKWRILTSTQRNTILTQAQDAISNARTLVLPDGQSFSVYFNPQGAFVETKINTAAGIRYNIELSFVEA